MFEKALRRVEGGTVLRVQVSPGSAKDSWAGYDEWREAVKVKIAAEPRGGMANEALVEFVARSFGILPGSVEIVAGAKSRLKEVILGGVDEESANQRLMEVLKS
jgi:uncharacterized protein (TIGR00251 family)